MTRRTLARLSVLVVLLTLAGAFSGVAQARHPHGFPTRYALTTKAPYVPQGGPWTYQRPPAGFRPVFTENVSRHGARTLSDSEDGDALLTLWRTAQSQGGLTRLGRGLGPEVERLLAANAKVGYGMLSASGKRSLRDTAVRLARRLPGLFSGAARAGGERVEVESSSIPRAIASSDAFVGGLEAAVPGLAPTVGADTVNDDLLYFHKAKINKDYQDYVKHDPRVAAAEAAVRADPRTGRAARRILERSFTPAFVDRIAAGEFTDVFADATAAADAVYSLWAVTADLPDEGHWHMDRYLGRRDAAWFGYLDDVTSFYENGPGFQGDDITYRMAGVLLKDLFAQLDAKRDGTSSLAAVLRFTHAEVVFPLAALLQLPGSAQQQPEGTLFTYADNPFRGATVAPMAANIQWDLFARGEHYLVRMLYDEKQTRFKAACRPVRPGSYYYDLDELERCYGYAAS